MTTDRETAGRPVLQIPMDYIRQDGDGYYLFPLPATVYIQRLDGEPLDPEEGEMHGYVQLTIYEDGGIKIQREQINIAHTIDIRGYLCYA